MELFGEDPQQKYKQPNYSEHKVQYELHRIMGFLRFNPDNDGVYVARCAPDHYILPALAGHFRQRFGKTAWVIIDEKRGLCLCSENGDPVRIIPYSNIKDTADGTKDKEDSWEELWKLYHNSVNIKERENPRLQQQLIPKRYRKYLPEISTPP